MPSFFKSTPRSGKKTRISSSKPGQFTYENLEVRNLLANIVATDAFLADGNNMMDNTPVLGERLAVQVDWTTEDLADDDEYDISITLDGYTHFVNDVFSGTGDAVGSFLRREIGGWFAKPGTHTVTVIMDVNDDVTEDNETDNTQTFTFETFAATNLPQRFQSPLEGTFYVDTVITQYTDIEPGGNIIDYNDGNLTRNNHLGLNVGPLTFEDMDNDWSVYAAANGVVVSTHDGEFDRNTNFNSSGQTNFIVIDHGNGWSTQYSNLRSDSVGVALGQTVSAGQEIAMLGASGNADGPALEFNVLHHGRHVETLMNSSTFWVDPPAYPYDQTRLIDTALFNSLLYTPSANHLLEGASTNDQMADADFQEPAVYAWIAGLQTDNVVQFRWRTPNGGLYFTDTQVITADTPWTIRSSKAVLPFDPELGTWRAEVYVNSFLLGTQPIEIVASKTPEIRIEEQGGNIVVDNRTTPINFGTIGVNDGASRTFTIVNSGDELLSITGVSAPAGFQVIDFPRSLIASGGSDTFTVRMNAGQFQTGYRIGEIKVTSSDASEPEYNFAVEGRVTAKSELLEIGVSERTISELGNAAGNVRRISSDISLPLTVFLSSDSSEIVYPSSVTIPANETYAYFPVVGIDDRSVDGDRTFSIRATSGTFEVASYQLEVEDVGLNQVIGTFDDDVIVLEYGTSPTDDIRLNVNSVTYIIDPLLLNEYTFDAQAGNDTITIINSTGQEIANVDSNHVQIDGFFTFFGDSVEKIILESKGGEDLVNVKGTVGDDELILNGTRTLFSAGGVNFEIEGYKNINIDGFGGNDSAVLVDTVGNDRLMASPVQTTFKRSDLTINLDRFNNVKAFSPNGGDDVALLTGSDADDSFFANENFINLRGPDYVFNAAGFPRADGDGGLGFDQADFVDSAGKETFFSTPNTAYMDGSAFFNFAKGFERVTARSQGGLDLAIMNDSPADDTLYATPTYAALFGANYRTQANGFGQVTALATAGENIATLRDSAGDDTYVATSTYAFMNGEGFLNYTRGFDIVAGTSSTGFDKAILRSAVGNSFFKGNYGFAFLAGLTGNNYVNSASNFARLSVFAAQTGTATAQISDSAGDDTFIANGKNASIFDDSSMIFTNGFKKITASSVNSGTNKLHKQNINFELTEEGNWT